MKAQELHIGLDLELQKLNSSSTKNIKPQEKDWFLNKEALKYVQKHTTKKGNIVGAGFEDTSKRIDDLRDLKETKEIIPIITDGKAEIVLPSDYFKYVRADLPINKKCNDNVQYKTKKTYLTEIDVDLDRPTFNSLSIQLSTDNGLKQLFVSTSDLPEGYLQRLDYQKQAFMLIKALKIQMNRRALTAFTSPFELYWENIGTTYKRNTFFLSTDLKVFNSSLTAAPSPTKIIPTVTKEIKYPVLTNKPILADIRIIDDEFFTDVSKSSLSGSKPDSLIGRVEKSSIMLNLPENVILGKVELTYLKKPNLIDIYLNSDLNMSDSSCNEILVNTVKYIKALIDSDSYDKYSKENILIE